MRIILVRHGETDANVEKRVQGHLDTHLNARGQEQATELAKILHERENIDAVFTSPLNRASVTAEIISDGKVPVIPITGLIERHMGPVEGMLHKDALAKRKEDGLPSLLCYGENADQLCERLIAGYFSVEDYAREHGYQTVVIVSHGSALANLLPKLVRERIILFANRKVQKRYYSRPKFGNCSVSIVNNGKLVVYCEQWTESIVRERSLV